MKKTLIATLLAATVSMPAMAQMSMDAQIAAIRAAEIEIQQIEAQKAHEAELVAKRAADIKRRAEAAKQKALEAQRQKEEARKAKLQAYDDQERELAIELKKLDVELKRAEGDLKKKMIQARANKADAFIQTELDEAQAKVDQLKAQIKRP